MDADVELNTHLRGTLLEKLTVFILRDVNS